MTTYGTISTSASPDTATNLEFISRATDKIRSGLGSRRPWKEVFSIHSLSLPISLNDALFRIKTNLAYFRMNYAIVVLFILFLSLLWHPISLIVFIAMMAAWLFLYFLRDAPLVVLDRVVDDKLVLAVLAVFTVAFLLLTDVTANIVLSLVVAAAAVVIHAAFRRTDDLPVTGVDFDYEGSTRVVYSRSTGGLGERLPLKDTASSSYSSN